MQAANYPHWKAATTAEVMAWPDACDDDGTDLALTVEDEYGLDDAEHAEIMRDVRQRFDDVATIKWVQKLHDQFGHPSGRALAAALKEMHFSPEVVRCAQMYVCEICLRRQRPRAHRVVSLSTATMFNQVVDVDTFYVEWDGKRVKVFSILWTRIPGTKLTR